jgi:hypothetical protein
MATVWAATRPCPLSPRHYRRCRAAALFAFQVGCFDCLDLVAEQIAGCFLAEATGDQRHGDAREVVMVEEVAELAPVVIPAAVVLVLAVALVSGFGLCLAPVAVLPDQQLDDVLDERARLFLADVGQVIACDLAGLAAMPAVRFPRIRMNAEARELLTVS